MRAGRGDDAGVGGLAPVVVRAGSTGDAWPVAQLHAAQITEGFLSSLGPRFLERLYRRMCRTEGSFLFVGDAEGTVVGFVAGSVDTAQLFSGFVRRDGLVAAMRAPFRLLSSWRRVLETLRHGRPQPEDTSDGELLAIAVHPAWRRQQLGARLVQALLEEMRKRSADTVEVVVGAENASAIAMYEAAGFVCERRFELHAGTTSLALRHRSRDRRSEQETAADG